jgi:hypothetical protein
MSTAVMMEPIAETSPQLLFRGAHAPSRVGFGAIAETPRGGSSHWRGYQCQHARARALPRECGTLRRSGTALIYLHA